MKKLLITIAAVLTLMSCSPEEQAQAQAGEQTVNQTLEGSWGLVKEVIYYLNEPHRDEQINIYNGNEIIITRGEIPEGVYYEVMEGSFSRIFVPLGGNEYTCNVFGQVLTYEVLLDGNSLSIEDVTNEETGTKRTVNHYNRL